MNKICKLAVSLNLLLVFSFSQAFANLPGATGGNPYSFGTAGRTVQDLTDYNKPQQMISIVPNRPIAARDKHGNRVYFTPNGKMTLRVSNDGSMVFNFRGRVKEINKDGELVSTTENEQGTNMVLVKNDKGEVVGSKEMGFGNKTLKEYDKEGNLVKSFKYNKFGKQMEFVLNELTQTRTVFNEGGLPVVDVDFEGNEISWYSYDQDNRLEKKEDVYGNVSFMDDQGRLTHTVDYWGNTVAKYNYKEDENGYYYLDTVENIRDNTITFYEDGKQQYIKDEEGKTVKEYHWDEDTLVYVYDYKTQQTTYFNELGRPEYTTLGDLEISRWLYHKGRLLGQWNQADGRTIIFQFERQDIVIESGDEPPTAEEIQKWIDEGIIDVARERSKAAAENTSDYNTDTNDTK